MKFQIWALRKAVEHIIDVGRKPVAHAGIAATITGKPPTKLHMTRTFATSPPNHHVLSSLIPKFPTNPLYGHPQNLLIYFIKKLESKQVKTLHCPSSL